MIAGFFDKYRFLSNFWPVPGGIVLDGRSYTTVEHAYQAAKTEDYVERLKIHGAVSPGDAKRLGRKVKVRDNWEQIKLELMLNLVRDKFSPGTRLARRLVETGEDELVEENSWGDTFWGCRQGVGQNHLGKILMQVRTELEANA